MGDILRTASGNFPHFNSFPANVPILYSLKTPENQRFSGVFRVSKMGTFSPKWVNVYKGIQSYI